ncbi:MAG: RNA 2',3'-cyclic phosphodiesterase [Chloroflexota bacterium]
MPMQSTHNSKGGGTDEQVRCFVAIELPADVTAGLADLRAQLERPSQHYVKWVRPEAIHLTLKFLGNIQAGRQADVTDAVRRAVRGARPCHLEVSGLGGFPSLQQPRVLWVAVSGDIDQLQALQQEIDNALADLGFPREERRFVPHLTLARVRQGASSRERKALGDVAVPLRQTRSYPLVATSVSLMRSQLTPDGAIYTCLSKADLRQ